MKKIAKFFTYVINMLVCLSRMAEAVNKAESPEELDRMICGR